MTLIDNGSAINVYPLRAAHTLGIPQEEFKVSNQAIRAYDNTRRDTVGMVWLNITSCPIEKRTKFHVMDIKSNFNLLLGRPWLHKLGAFPSTLHQKTKFLLDGALIIINASPLKIQHHAQPIINIEHNENDEDLWGFTVAMLEEEDKAPFAVSYTHLTLPTNRVV